MTAAAAGRYAARAVSFAKRQYSAGRDGVDDRFGNSPRKSLWQAPVSTGASCRRPGTGVRQCASFAAASRRRSDAGAWNPEHPPQRRSVGDSPYGHDRHRPRCRHGQGGLSRWMNGSRSGCATTFRAGSRKCCRAAAGRAGAQARFPANQDKGCASAAAAERAGFAACLPRQGAARFRAVGRAPVPPCPPPARSSCPPTAT